MFKPMDDFVSTNRSGFLSSKGRKLPFDEDILAPEARARKELLGFQRSFLGKSKHSAKDVSQLIDQMVAFEKVRSGSGWRDSDAASVARTVRSMVDRTGGSLNFGEFEPRRPRTMARLVRMDLPELDLDPFVLDNGDGRGETQIIDLNTVNCGTYFDKWFNYNGAWTLTTLYDNAKTDPPFSFDFVQAHNYDPHGEDTIRATSETGIWFTYVPDIDGYVTLLWVSENATMRNYREYYGTGDSFAMTNVEAVAGVWADEFEGREYLNLSPWSTNPLDERKMFSPLIISNSTYPVRAGRAVNVMVGTRSKLLAQGKGPGLNAAVGILAPFTKIAALTRSDREPYNPFTW